jgi:hypothetical protein
VKGENKLEANSNSESMGNLYTRIEERLPIGLVNAKCLTYSFITGLKFPSFVFMVEV